MSPPQADMQSKPAPYLISQEDESRKVNKLATRKFRIVAITVILSLLIVGATVFGAIAYSYRLFYKKEYKAESRVDGEKLSENIYVDYKKEMIYVNNKKTGRIDGMKALHNYNRKLVALYDETNNICLIDKLDESFDEGLKYWSKYQGVDSSNSNLNFTYDSEPIKANVLRRFGGDEIAYHCGKANSTAYWILGSKPITGEVKDDEPQADAPAAEDDKHARVKRGYRVYYRCRYYRVSYRGRIYIVRHCRYYIFRGKRSAMLN